VRDAPVQIDGIIGLSRKYRKYGLEYSLIHNLYNQGVISQKIFSQKIDGEDAKFYIGVLPEEISKDMKKYKQNINLITNMKLGNTSQSIVPVPNFYLTRSSKEWTHSTQPTAVVRNTSEKQTSSPNLVI
jgi:hypothetical protein